MNKGVFANAALFLTVLRWLSIQKEEPYAAL